MFAILSPRVVHRQTCGELHSSWNALTPPLGFHAGDTNLQRYVGNSPTNATDPSGLIAIYFDGAGQEENAGTIVDTMLHSTISKLKSDPALAKRYSGCTSYLTGIVDNRTHANTQAAYDTIKKALKTNPNQPIDLIGWSRGAVDALIVAHMLKKDGIEVRFLGMIDPVEAGSNRTMRKRYGDGWTAKIPDNVKNLWVGYADATENAADKAVFKPWQVEYKLENDKTTKETVKRYPNIGHARSGWMKEIGKDLWDSAATVGVPLEKSPYEP